MANDRINVFLTGATGVMGFAGLKELMNKPELYSVTVLARPSKKNRKKLADAITKGIKVIWGDLLDYSSVYKGIQSADIVLHVGGMVSPEADLYPEKTKEVNIGSMQLIVNAVKEIENSSPDKIIKTVYIGSVSQYGSHLPPHHWGKVGDKLLPAKNDAYAYSKIKAEDILRNSGLKKWVSLRQTAILHPGLLNKIDNPVMFHVPLEGALEWISVEDSGRVLERVCNPEISDSFWNNCYNIGGGESYRLINYEFEKKLLKAIGCPPPEKIFERRWFCTDNFHGIWFEDSDTLDDILHFRSGKTFDQTLLEMKKELPFYFKLTPLAPSLLIKYFMKRVAGSSPLGPLSWIKNNDFEHIDICWGGISNFKKIGDWSTFNREFKFPRVPASATLSSQSIKEKPLNE